MKILVCAIVSVFATSASLQVATAQDGQSQAKPCAADPAAPPGGGSLTQKLNDCNGVLVPPKIGDSGIVEPAPEGGEIRMIPPSSVPEQNSDLGKNDGRQPGTSGRHGYDIAELVDAIARSGATARSLAMLQDPQVKVRDISILLRASNAAVPNVSLTEHAGAVESLREAISGNSALASAVAGMGYSVEGIVAAQIDKDKSVTLFGR